MKITLPDITPGDWKPLSRSCSDNSLVIKTDSAGDYDEICCLRDREKRSYGPQDERDMANASAIVAVPELLSALVEIAGITERFSESQLSFGVIRTKAVEALRYAGCTISE